MELLNPTSLWKEYDRRKEPLEASVISVRTENAVTTERLYFSGAPAEDGTTRVYARLTYPDGCDFKLVTVVIGSIGKSVDDMEIRRVADIGGAVLAVDYAGRGEYARYTLYPRSLAFAEPAVTPDTFGRLPDSPRNTCWYVWTVNLLRAVTYIESRFPDAEIVLVGVNDGGAQAIKAASLIDAAGTVVIGASRADSDDMTFKASLSSEAYTPKIDSPLLLMCGSNVRGNAADRATEAFNAASAGTRLFIRPRAFGRITRTETDNIEWFIRAVTTGQTLPDGPVIEARASEAHLYCDVSAPGADSVQLYSAQSAGREFLRNWHRVPCESAGESYLARVSVYTADEPVYLLAVARYGKLMLSSPVTPVNPAALGILPDTLTRNRLLYDAEWGVDDWIAGEGDEPARMAYGALGIAGVTGEKDIATFKPGDRVYAAGAGDVLQVLLYSETKQTVTLYAIDREGVTYSCDKPVSPFSGWTKFTLSAVDFKSRDGALGAWSAAACFGVQSAKPVVVNSLLWV